MRKSSTSTATGESFSGGLRRLGRLLANWRQWADKRAEFSLFLQRSFWTPLRNAVEIFHLLPLVAVVIVLVLLATHGQFREIYISYLEGLRDGGAASVMRILAALTAVTFMSAVLYQAHLTLGTMRLNVVFSGQSDPRADSKLPRLQRAAAFAIAFMPWIGLTIGLFNARNFVAARYCQLLMAQSEISKTLSGVSSPPPSADVQSLLPADMNAVPGTHGVTVAAAVILLGAVAAYFVSVDDRNHRAHYAVAWVGPALAALLLLLFTDWLSADTWMSWWTWVCGAVGAATAIYVWRYRRLYRRRGGSAVARAFIRTGMSFRKRLRVRLALWAFLPWLAIALYFLWVQVFVPDAQTSDGCSDPFASAVNLLGPGRWAIFPIAMSCTIAIGLLVSHFLLRLDSRKWFAAAFPFVILALALAVAFLAIHNDAGLIVSVYRLIGPLATVSLALLFVISTFAALAALSQNSGFPALTLIVLTIIVCVTFPNYAGWTAFALGIAYALFAAAAFISGRAWAGLVLVLLIFVGWMNYNEFQQEPIDSLNDESHAAAALPPDLRTAYLCWLDQRGVPAARTPAQARSCDARPQRLPAVNGKYPVFIFAAEGGGIYAAGAAATFLAKLEDCSPGFARHIFAISGVSGGAIDAAVFQALDHARHPDAGPALLASASEPIQPDSHGKCAPHVATPGGKTLADEAADIMRDDHFSPIVGSIFPEIFNAPLKRPDALQASFEYSASAQEQAAGVNLRAPFLGHWTPAGDAPALILNTTWVEKGYRVAFAPFRLHDLDDSLYSFVDPLMPKEDDCEKPIEGRYSCVSLMAAAGVSARFPGIMPPFSVRLDQNKRWNFVDGGYADNSGATTALDIYHALNGVSDQVDLRIVLITSANPQPKLDDNSINGTVFRDTVAPIDAILKVREDLGSAAVARACSDVNKDKTGMGRHESCVDHDHAGDRQLQIVEIEDQRYGLPLGWKISRTSFAVIQWMLGDPMLCPDAHKATNGQGISEQTQAQTAAQGPDAASEQSSKQASINQATPPNPVTGSIGQLNDDTVIRNSCVSWSLEQMVEKSSAGGSESSGQKH